MLRPQVEGCLPLLDTCTRRNTCVNVSAGQHTATHALLAIFKQYICYAGCDCTLAACLVLITYIYIYRTYTYIYRGQVEAALALGGDLVVGPHECAVNADMGEALRDGAAIKAMRYRTVADKLKLQQSVLISQGAYPELAGMGLAKATPAATRAREARMLARQERRAMRAAGGKDTLPHVGKVSLPTSRSIDGYK